MRWQAVREFAESQALELYTPMCGYHKQLQIIDRTDDLIISILFFGSISYYQLIKAIANHQRTPRHWWTSNKAGQAYQSLLVIAQQKELAKISNEQAIADGIAAKESII